MKFLEEDGMDDGGVSMDFFNTLAKELKESQILTVNEHGVAWFSKKVRIQV